jgi:hypothetical protein
MIDNRKAVKKRILLGRICMTLALGLLIMNFSGCAYRVLFWKRNMWQDMQCVVTMVAPADIKLYRELLPRQFDLPDQPMVGIFVMDYLDTEPWMITPTKFLRPYLEASILLRCNYEDRTGWYSLTMPVTDEGARIGGRRLGFPKYIADSITLYQTATGWSGKVVRQGTSPICLEFTPAPLSGMGKLNPVHEAFMQGEGDAELKGPFILLVPPEIGPRVKVIPISPPPRAIMETGQVKITLAAPWNGLVPDGTVSPGLFERFTVGAGK